MRFSLPRFVLFAALCALPFRTAVMRAAVSIPDDVSIRIFAEPVSGSSGSLLRLAVRVPMSALNQIQFPVRENGYLDMPRADTALPGAARYWIASSIDVRENGALLPKPRIVSTRVAIESDSSFASIDRALAHLAGPELADTVDILPEQSWLDILFEYPVRSAGSSFAIQTKFAHLGVHVSTSLVFLPPGRAPREFSWTGDTGEVVLDPSWSEAGLQFLRWGFEELTGGTDYLLIVFCLVLPFWKVRDIVPVIAAFAGAIPITLIASACGLAPDTLWFGPLVITLVAVAILYTALEDIAGNIGVYRRATLALVFGLLFGFDFSIALAAKEQFAGSYPLVSAVAFNVGIELGLLAVALVLFPVLHLLFRFSSAKRIESIVLAALAAHTAWHWMEERWARLSRFPLRWPVIDAALLAAAMRWMMILVIFGGAVWFISGALRSREQRRHEA